MVKSFNTGTTTASQKAKRDRNSNYIAHLLVCGRRAVLFALLTLTLLTPLTATAAEPQFLDTFRPDNRVHDFGRIRESDGRVTHIFRLRNEGNKPVAISAVNTWCGCMVAGYTKRAIRPGETANISVTLDPDHKSGKFIKQVVVLTDGGQKYVRLWVKADITPEVHPISEECPYDFGQGLWMSQKMLPFPDLDKGQEYGFDLRVGNNTQRRMTVTFTRQPNNRVLRMPESLTLAPGERKTIRVSYRYPRRHPHPCYVDIHPTVNGKAARTLRIKWNAGGKFRIL